MFTAYHYYALLPRGNLSTTVLNTNYVTIKRVTGNVGIGTTNPGDKLSIQGGALSFHNPSNPVPYVGLDYDPTIDALRIRGNLSTTVLNTNYVTIKRVTGNVGIGTTNPLEKLVVVGNIRATGTLFQGSSRELKENIIELSSHEAIKALDDLNPVKFKYRADSEEKLHIGFIAEDVPELVATSDRKGLSSMDIVGVLTKVVQEQQKTILALVEEVRALKEHKVVS